MPKPFMPQDYFEMWQKMFAPAFGSASMSGAAQMQEMMFPDLKSVERKIAELEAVEAWLKSNLGMLQMSIKNLEYQRAMLRSGAKVQEAFDDSRASAKSVRGRKK